MSNPRIWLVGLLVLMVSCSTVRNTFTPTSERSSKREFRGAWIQTVFQNEYSLMSPDEMKQDFIRKLDILQACGINAIIFQVRPEADAFYASDIEPWSRFFTGEQGKAPEGDFDLMAFLIEECHKRMMEFHAWLNPYRASADGKTVFADSHIYHQHPERFVVYNNQILFDPGIPDNRQYICSVVRDIVMRYDVDAIHMDDYFYPYPANGIPFPDEESFLKYGLPEGYSERQKGDWRRENVNRLISELKRTILLTKPWVRFGISPFGIYRNKSNTPDGSGSETNGLQNYDDLYADVLHWVRQGWIDYNMPQIYWEIGHTAADYNTLIQWWDANAYNRPLYIGQDVARTMTADQLEDKMTESRRLPHVDGNCFWPANEILWNTNGVADKLQQTYHRYPALIPAFTHLHEGAPKAVKKLQAEWTVNGYFLHWEADHSKSNPESAHYYVIYRFDKNEKKDLNNPANIIAITDKTNYMLPYEKGTHTFYYIVTAVDRFHNESNKGKLKKVKL
ncbi:family 10 glycosylhydrolase [Parabacteroides sp. OttesenSCG-928-G07]|nr:family 10 glycosylhydrolase [Parabacteroides sp. OttesenSCG-928-G07]